MSPYAAPQDNQCEWHMKVCEACATAFVSSAGICMANYILFKDNRIQRKFKYSLNISKNVERIKRKKENVKPGDEKARVNI